MSMTEKAILADDLYDLLDVEPSADVEEMRSAFRNLAKTCHPDAGGSVERFMQVRHAYDVLTDPDERLRYDLEREERLDASPKPHTHTDRSHLSIRRVLVRFKRTASSATERLRIWWRFASLATVATVPALLWSYGVTAAAVQGVTMSPFTAMLHPTAAWSQMWSATGVGGFLTVITGSLIGAAVLTGVTVATKGRFRWPIRVAAYWLLGSLLGDVVGTFQWQSILVVPVVTIGLLAAAAPVWRLMDRLHSVR